MRWITRGAISARPTAPELRVERHALVRPASTRRAPSACQALPAAAAAAASNAAGANPRPRSARHAASNPSCTASSCEGTLTRAHAAEAHSPTSSSASRKYATSASLGSTSGSACETRSCTTKNPTRFEIVAAWFRKKSPPPLLLSLQEGHSERALKPISEPDLHSWRMRTHTRGPGSSIQRQWSAWYQ